MTIAYDAMCFAMETHKNQKRKYTRNPYTDHLAEVAGITATILNNPEAIAVAWLHDCVEDQGVSEAYLAGRFGTFITLAVMDLSDIETGNRATRKEASRKRLSQAPNWVQTIKCADLISNTRSIVEHDPDFAWVYLDEKRQLLDVMRDADPSLWNLARHLCAKGYVQLMDMKEAK